MSGGYFLPVSRQEGFAFSVRLWYTDAWPKMASGLPAPAGGPPSMEEALFWHFSRRQGLAFKMDFNRSFFNERHITHMDRSFLRLAFAAGMKRHLVGKLFSMRRLAATKDYP